MARSRLASRAMHQPARGWVIDAGELLHAITFECEDVRNFGEIRKGRQHTTCCTDRQQSDVQRYVTIHV